MIDGGLGLHDFPARKNVYRSVAILRPGVNRKMRSGDHDNPTDPKWVKLVKGYRDNGRLRPPRRLHHLFAYLLKVFQHFSITVIQLEKDVPSERVHLPSPPSDSLCVCSPFRPGVCDTRRWFLTTTHASLQSGGVPGRWAIRNVVRPTVSRFSAVPTCWSASPSRWAVGSSKKRMRGLRRKSRAR